MKAVTPAYEIPLDDNELAIVGRFILVWNQAEQLLEMVVMQATGLDWSIIVPVMGSPTTKPKVDVVLAVAELHIRDPEIKRQVQAASKRLLGMADFRNEVAHSRWAYNLDKNHAESRKRMGAQKAITLQAIEQKLPELCQITRELADAFWHLLGQPPPSPWRETL